MLQMFMLGLLLAVVLFVIGEVWALVTWRKAWRMLAVLAGVPLVVNAGLILFDTWINPASHNMWPFELIVCSVFGLLVLASLWLVQMFVNHGKIVR